MGHLVDHLGPGGAERLLVAYLARAEQLELEPRVLAFNDRGGDALIRLVRSRGVPVTTLGVRRMADPSGLPRVLRWLRRHRIEVVHAQLELASLLGPVAARILRIPSVSTLHTLDVGVPGGRAGARRRLVTWALARPCDRVIAVSDAARRHHIAEDGLPEHKLVTIRNGIELDRFRPAGAGERARARAELGIAPQARVMVTVAVLREAKGIQHLVEALAAIAAAVPDALALIVGDGPHRRALEDLVARRGVADRLRFAGARSDVKRHLAAADLFVLPTLTEALPTVLAEAMGAGLPIVASAVGGVPEMVLDGENGLLVPPGEPIALAEACRRLLTDREEATRMGAAGRRVAAERFEIGRQAARVADLYRALVAARGRA